MSSLKLLLYITLFCDACFGTPIQSFHFIKQVGQPEIVSVIFGGKATLDCRTSDNGATVTLWKNTLPHKPRDYRKIVPDGKKIVVGKTGYFTIERVEISDGLRYRCKAHNKAGVKIHKDLTIHINSLRPGLIIKPEHPQTILTGANASFTCETQAGSIDWFKKITKLDAQGKEVDVSRKMIQRSGSKIVDTQSVGYKTSVLTVSNAKTSDTGIYECVLNYHLYELIKSTRLYVYAPESPSIETITPSKAVREGEDLVLRCNVKGYPDPKITWFKDGFPLPVCVKNSNSKCTTGQRYIWRDDRQDLKIRRVHHSSDDGVFTCEAINNFGRATADVNLTVLTTPVLRKNVMKTIWAFKHQLRPISCEVDHSNPEPKISWTMQYLPYSCISKPDPFSDSSCQPKGAAWTGRGMYGTFSPSSKDKPTMKSSYTPPKWMSLAYYKCTAQNVFGSESMVFGFRRH